MILNSASESSADVIALIEGKAYPIVDKKNDIKSIRKDLDKFGWDKYAAARMHGHILFMEGETDLKMMTAMAEKLNHPVFSKLPHANVYYIHGNSPYIAVNTFVSFKSFFPKLKGLAIFDKLEKNVTNQKLKIITLKKRELENYFISPNVLYSFAESLVKEQQATTQELHKWMQEAIEDNTTPARLRNLHDSWWSEEKITENWLDLIFPSFYDKLPRKISYKNFKTNYWQLVNYVSIDDISQEISAILDEIEKIVTA